MHTQDEAKKLWCPMVRAPLFNPENHREQIAGNAAAIPGAKEYGSAVRCIAGDCAMWRELPSGRGYCGLAPIPGNGLFDLEGMEKMLIVINEAVRVIMPAALATKRAAS